LGGRKRGVSTPDGKIGKIIGTPTTMDADKRGAGELFDTLRNRFKKKP